MQTLLLIALLAAAPAGRPAPDPDFDDDFGEDSPGLALGPVPKNEFIASADVGWLRSAIRGNVGLGRDIDFVFWIDAFLLEDLFDQQNGIHTGVRYTPLRSGPFRLSIEGTVGAIFIANRVAASNVFALRGEATAGLTRPSLGTAYARLQVRGLTDAAARDAHWGRDNELGFGAERSFGPVTLAGEFFLWSRPDLASIRQWRFRVGYHF